MTIKEQVYRMWKSGLTTSQIIKKSGFSDKQVRYAYSAYGLKANRYVQVDLDNDLLQFVIGSILGDGSFTKLSKLGKESHLRIVHSGRQEEYLIWKYNFLSKYDLTNTMFNRWVKSNRYKNGGFREIGFKTKSNPIFTQIRNSCYLDGKTIINRKIIDKIDALGLAIWYMDDGNVTTNSFHINMKCCESDIGYFINLFKNKFDLDVTVVKSGIYITSSSRDKFKEIVKPYIHESMMYKLIPYSYRVL